MLTCRQLVEQISDYIDGNLGLMDRTSLRLHLMMCRHCSTYTTQLRQMVEALRSLPPDAQPPDFEAVSAAVLSALETPDGEPSA
jgi:anti-sigma factor RsiW